MLSLVHRRCAHTATGVLLAAVERLADVIARPMPDDVVELDLNGERPVVFLDPHASLDDLDRVLPEVLAAIVIGPRGAPSARQTPKLVAV